MTDVKIKRDLKIQANRFKGLLKDIEYYGRELNDFGKQQSKYSDITDVDERASKLKLLANQEQETKSALADCKNRIKSAQNDLYSMISSFPAHLKKEGEYVDAVAVYRRSGEVDLPFDEEL